jgi:hypothetical protein
LETYWKFYYFKIPIKKKKKKKQKKKNQKKKKKTTQNKTKQSSVPNQALRKKNKQMSLNTKTQ